MREISQDIFPPIVAKLVEEANYKLPPQVEQAIIKASKQETSELGRHIFSQMLENIKLAKKKKLPLCQDTGLQEVFVTIGNDVQVAGDIEKAINDGIKKGTQEGRLRSSIVKCPVFSRTNTNDNTPAVIHYDFTPGDKIKITVMPKGFGSENASAVKMLTPSDGVEGIKNFVLEVVKKYGANACPPFVDSHNSMPPINIMFWLYGEIAAQKS